MTTNPSKTLKIKISNSREFASVLTSYFFTTPGKLEEKFLVCVRLVNGTLYLLPTIACKDHDDARASALRELTKQGYQQADIVDCYVYSLSDIEDLGLAAPEGSA